MLKDFKLEFGQAHVHLLEEVKRLIKAININITKEPGSLQDLTYEGYVHFLLQYAYYVYEGQTEHRDDIRALNLVERLFNHIKAQQKFKDLGLHMTKLETTNRKDIEVLQKLEAKII